MEYVELTSAHLDAFEDGDVTTTAGGDDLTVTPATIEYHDPDLFEQRNHVPPHEAASTLADALDVILTTQTFTPGLYYRETPEEDWMKFDVATQYNAVGDDLTAYTTAADGRYQRIYRDDRAAGIDKLCDDVRADDVLNWAEAGSHERPAIHRLCEHHLQTLIQRHEEAPDV